MVLVVSIVFLALATAGGEKAAVQTSEKQSKCSVSKASETIKVEKNARKSTRPVKDSKVGIAPESGEKISATRISEKKTPIISAEAARAGEKNSIEIKRSKTKVSPDPK